MEATADVKPSAATAVVHSPAAVETTTASMETTATVPSSAMLSECGFRRPSKRNKCKACKQDFGEGGFSHFDYLHQTTGDGLIGSGLAVAKTLPVPMVPHNKAATCPITACHRNVKPL